MPKTRLIVPLACDLSFGGSRLGAESLWRLDRALEVNREERTEGEFFFSAGMAPGRQFSRQTICMSYMQRQYLNARGVSDSQLHIGHPVWGSREEIRATLDYIRGKKGQEMEVIFVSSWYHLPRLHLLLRQYLESHQALQNTNFRFVACRGHLVNALKEPAKLAIQALGLA